MEIISSSLPTPPHIFFFSFSGVGVGVVSNTNKHSITIYTTRRRNNNNFRVSARKNHLRKKLIEQQVLLPSIYSPNFELNQEEEEIVNLIQPQPEPELSVNDNANFLPCLVRKPKLTRVVFCGYLLLLLLLLVIAFDRFFRKFKPRKQNRGSLEQTEELLVKLDQIHEIAAAAAAVSVPDNKHPVTKQHSSIVDSKLRIITSPKEAKQYLHNTHNKQHQLPNTDTLQDPSVKGKWIEDNFHEFEPLVHKIRGGFRNSYMAARQKVKQDMDLVLELQPHDDDETEFEWMKDDKLREIVFQVRENELMGRDPFYLMDAQDKALFFKGLEDKVDKENEKLAHLHEYLHSNIENLDYGADGISLYDSPEKIIPRWKGPPPTTTTSQEFLDNYLDQRKTLFAETLGNLDLHSQNSSNEKVVSNKQTNEKLVNKSSKTVIEGSDGSVKPGKKSGKEFWHHTKKWSRGFIDSYNAENDPETKAAMKDIGKDLDRWITEKEIQDAADVMDKVPDKGKKFIAERVGKLKREMELFGPEVVVSKYSEYGDEEEEIDYYWWLDLPHLLCIEIYIDERIGFYSLEMASDLELDPKPHHIIAFEDAGDCKNLCYLIQTHMEMLGNGNAFVVPQMPKDTYREAKENGFNVTVIRKGELKLDVDQTLEEVEEKIVEIGSKMYHEQIMKSRNVNVDSVMKGVFGLKKNTSRRRLKRPTK